MEPGVEIKMTGTITDFARIDNVYTTMKREGSKLLDKWKIEINVSYAEQKSGEEE